MYESPKNSGEISSEIFYGAAEGVLEGISVKVPKEISGRIYDKGGFCESFAYCLTKSLAEFLWKKDSKKIGESQEAFLMAFMENFRKKPWGSIWVSPWSDF